MLTFTSASIILTMLPQDCSVAQKTARLHFEQVQFMVPRRPDVQRLACQIVTLPKPWLAAFGLVTALRPASSVQDVRLDVIPSTGVIVRTVGSACSRTLIEEAELYSLGLQRSFADGRLSLMVSFKEFGLVFELAAHISSMVSLFFDQREHADGEPGPIVLQVPSATGVEVELVVSALIAVDEADAASTQLAEESTVLSGRSAKRNKRDAAPAEEPDHVSESEYEADTRDDAGDNGGDDGGDDADIPPTPPYYL